MKIFSRVFSAFTAVLTGLVILFGACLVLPKLFGMDLYVVLTASMNPALPPGSVVMIDTHDTSPQEGEIATYWLTDEDGEKILITHRVEAVEKDGSYLFKGDANENTDFYTVTPDQIAGTYVLHVPQLGRVLKLLESRHGFLLAGVWTVMLNGLAAFFGYAADQLEREKTEDLPEEEKGKNSGSRRAEPVGNIFYKKRKEIPAEKLPADIQNHE